MWIKYQSLLKAFESFLKLENKELQTQIYEILEEINKREEEKKELKTENEKNVNKISLNKNHKEKNIDIVRRRWKRTDS